MTNKDDSVYIDQVSFENFMEHVGIKGMRWGVRRSRSAKYAEKAAARSSRKKENQSRKEQAKNRKLLMEQDLDKYVARLEKEKKLKNLVAEEVTPGKSFAKAILSDVGKRSISTVGTGLAIYSVRAALTGKFDIKEAAQYMKPKK
jgi:hypothetical protein